MPIGMLITEAIATITSVPTTALPKPPPGMKPAGGSWVNRAVPSRAPPRVISM